MSLAPTSTLKAQLKASLGPNATQYFDALNRFVSGLWSRGEFEEAVKQCFGSSPNLIQLHNALVISLFDASSHQRPPTPPPDAPARPNRKRTRIFPYQGPGLDENAYKHSSRLRRWTVGIGRKERERVRGLLTDGEGSGLRGLDKGEIGSERGVLYLSERGESPGSRQPLPLATATRTLSVQHILERINLISAQHNLGPPSKSVASLLLLALEAKLKQLITHALTLTSSSSAISSIAPSVSHTPSALSTSSFNTLFTLSPSGLPNKSATAMRLMSEGVHEEDGEDEVKILKDREGKDHRWQLLALLSERSGVRHALNGMR